MAKSNQQLRIIGGTWRGRKLNFPDVPGLRPTPDRVRETLFNWLQADIAGADCLDLFAGSGALGFEALSRAAKQVIFVDAHPRAIEQIKQNAAKLKATNATFHVSDAVTYLEKKIAGKRFDLVFLDPPFHQNLLFSSLLALQMTSVLAVNAKVYVEVGSVLNEAALPNGWIILKSSTAGKIYYYLLSLQ